jgi:hypothetical protein
MIDKLSVIPVALVILVFLALLAILVGAIVVAVGQAIFG